MDEVINRWRLIYRGPEVIQRYLSGDALNEFELRAVSSIAETWWSWFMWCFNEHIAFTE
jgi:putative transposase